MPNDDDHVSETDFDDDLDSVVNDENAFDHPSYAPAPRATSLLARRTPHSPSHDTALCDITDQFFHPPSPSPIRVSKLKRPAPNTIEPPRRPKKPKSLAYPADPPNWLYSRSPSSLPPSSPFPISVDHFHSTDHAAIARHEYHLGTPSKASDSDPFGFVAVERAIKTKRAPAPTKPTSRISAVKSPPRSTVLTGHTVFSSFSQLDPPIPTNNEDIEGLYADEPVAGPSHVHVPVAPLLMMSSDHPLADIAPTRSQPTSPDPLRTPRKPRRRLSPPIDGDSNLDQEGSDIPSSPSPVKVSVGAGTRRRPASHVPVPKLTRAQTRAAGTAKPSTTQPSRTKRVKTSYQHIPTPSSTSPSVRPSSRHSTAPPTPVPPRRSTRQAAVGAVKLKGTHSTTSDTEDGGRMKLRSRSAKGNAESKSIKPTTRAKQPPSKPKASAKTQKTTATTTVKPARGRPKGKKSSTKGTKGKGKARPLESVLDLSDDTTKMSDESVWNISNAWRGIRYKRRTCILYEV
ncbi:hypothetical protein EV363DRAFT_1496 [Boletus edulis]|nr:hypothetical protein EV363DRAFT_1496 [Boletus edulis]